MSAKYPLTLEDIKLNRSRTMRYYYRNKDDWIDKQKIRQRIRYTCECGSNTQKGTKNIHERSKKHIKFITKKEDMNNINNEVFELKILH